MSLLNLNLGDCLLTSIKQKQILMGIAMTLVVLYHSMFIEVPFRYLFTYGYIGVDIFILLSGYGLCYSLKKNDIKTFYKRRVTRIIPLYIIAAAIHTCYNVFIDNKDESIWDWICDLTTLSYWQLGGHHIEWYLSALIFLYLLFPLFYYITKKIGVVAFFISVLCSFIMHLTIELDWTHWCLVDRIPIYIMGILCFFVQNSKSKTSLSRIIRISSILGVYFFIENFSMYFDRIESIKVLSWLPLNSLPLFRLHIPFLWACMLCPIIIVLFGKCIHHFTIRVNDFLALVGKYSLEVYTAQIIIIPLANYIKPFINSYALFVVYLILEVIGTMFMILINNQIKKYSY